MSGRSLWKDKTQLPEYMPLDGDITADVLVIGGGMAGLLTAYMLTRAGADCVLVEADRLCGGVSGDTTGKITALHGAVFDKLIREFGSGALGRILRQTVRLWRSTKGFAGISTVILRRGTRMFIRRMMPK